MPHNIICPHCHRAGWVHIKATSKTDAAMDLHCNYCDYGWRRSASGKDLGKTKSADDRKP